MSNDTSQDARAITIFYEVVPENPQEADPAEMQAVANEVVAALRQSGYTVTPVPTGALGGDLLYQIVPLVQTAITHKQEISSAIETTKSLVTQLLSWRKQHQADQVAHMSLGAMEVELNFGEDNFKFKSSGSEGTAEGSAMLDKFLASSTHTQQALLKAHFRQQVPARPRRKRR